LAYAIEKRENEIDASGGRFITKFYGPLLAAGLLTFNILIILFGALVLRRITQRHGMNKSCTFYDIYSSDSSDSSNSTDSVESNPSPDNYNDKGREISEEFFNDFDSDGANDKTEKFIDEYHENHERHEEYGTNKSIPPDNSIETIQSTQVSMAQTKAQRSSLHSNSTMLRINSIRTIPISSTNSHINSEIPQARIARTDSNATSPRISPIQTMPISPIHSHTNSAISRTETTRTDSITSSNSYSSTQVSMPRTIAQRSSLRSNDATSPRISSIQTMPISPIHSHTNSAISRTETARSGSITSSNSYSSTQVSMPRPMVQRPTLHYNSAMSRVNSVRTIPNSPINSHTNSAISRAETARTDSITSSNSYSSTQVSMPRAIAQRPSLHYNSTSPRISSIRSIPNSPINSHTFSAISRTETVQRPKNSTRRTRSVQLPAPVARIERGPEKRKVYYSYI
ncbi:17477_t:CDS:1, partial [Funneliformis caledonium]